VTSWACHPGIRQNHPMTNLNATRSQISSLNDEQAIQALKIVVQHDQLPVPTSDWDSAKDHIKEAIESSGLDAHAPPADAPCSDGDLARITLQYWAESGQHSAGVVGGAISYVSEPGERFDPVTLSLGGLVLAILQTDLKLKRDSKGNWTFELHKTPMRDSTLGKVITAFIGRFTNPGN
jgi:hypothetical protein